MSAVAVLDGKLSELKRARATLDAQIEVLEETRRDVARDPQGNSGGFKGMTAAAAVRAYLQQHPGAEKKRMVDELETQIASESANPRRSLMQAIYALQRKGEITKGRKLSLK